MLYKIKRFFKKIAKIISYLPILWRDEDWDFEFLVDLVAFKVERMSNCLGSSPFVDGRDMRIDMNQVLDHINNFKNSIDMYNEINDIETSSDYNVNNIPDYVKSVYAFEEDEWNKIWDTIKNRGQYWWD